MPGFSDMANFLKERRARLLGGVKARGPVEVKDSTVIKISALMDSCRDQVTFELPEPRHAVRLKSYLNGSEQRRLYDSPGLRRWRSNSKRDSGIYNSHEDLSEEEKVETHFGRSMAIGLVVVYDELVQLASAQNVVIEKLLQLYTRLLNDPELAETSKFDVLLAKKETGHYFAQLKLSVLDLIAAGFEQFKDPFENFGSLKKSDLCDVIVKILAKVLNGATEDVSDVLNWVLKTEHRSIVEQAREDWRNLRQGEALVLMQGGSLESKDAEFERRVFLPEIREPQAGISGEAINGASLAWLQSYFIHKFYKAKEPDPSIRAIHAGSVIVYDELVGFGNVMGMHETEKLFNLLFYLLNDNKLEPNAQFGELAKRGCFHEMANLRWRILDLVNGGLQQEFNGVLERFQFVEKQELLRMVREAVSRVFGGEENRVNIEHLICWVKALENSHRVECARRDQRAIWGTELLYFMKSSVEEATGRVLLAAVSTKEGGEALDDFSALWLKRHSVHEKVFSTQEQREPLRELPIRRGPAVSNCGRAELRQYQRERAQAPKLVPVSDSSDKARVNAAFFNA